MAEINAWSFSTSVFLAFLQCLQKLYSHLAVFPEELE